MQFSYTAINKSGEKQKGLIEANTQKEVIDFLRGKQLTPIGVREVHDIKENIKMFQKVKSSDIVLFTRQLSSMILTGLTLLEALQLLQKQSQNVALQDVITDIVERVSEGSSFSQALSNHRDVFSDVYIALVEAAETGGLLDKILVRLADNMERSEDLKKRIRSALFYPIIIIIGVVGVIVIMNVVVIPQLGGLYASLNLDLPLSTRIVLGISDITRKLFPLVIAGLVGLFFLYRKAINTATGKKLIDKVKLKLPVFGTIIKLSIISEVSRTLSILIASGSSIIESLTITARVSNNYYYHQAIDSSSVLVEKGVPLSTAFENQGIFEPIVVQMIKVGESTGKLDESLLKLSDYFERDLNIKVKTLTTAIEPLLIVTLGITVGFLVFSVITPIYSLITQIQ